MEQISQGMPPIAPRCLTVGVELEFFVPRRFPSAPSPRGDGRYCKVIHYERNDHATDLSQELRQLRRQLAETAERGALQAEQDKLYDNALLKSLNLATEDQMEQIANVLTRGFTSEGKAPVSKSRLEARLPSQAAAPAVPVQTRCVAQGHLQGVELGSLDESGIHQGYKEWVLSQEESFMWYGRGRGSRNKHYPAHQSAICDWLGLELATRVFRDVDAARVELIQACDLLRRYFLVSVNIGTPPRAAGLHVHWGLQAYDAVDMVLIAKRLLTFMWLTERKLMDLHASWRRAPATAKYAALLGSDCNLAKPEHRSPPHAAGAQRHQQLVNGTAHEMGQNLPTAYRQVDKIGRIWGAKTVEELAFLARSTKGTKGALSFQELLQPNDPSKGNHARKTMLKTVEFRHMQGSLEPEHIHAWMVVTERVMTICATDNSPASFSALLAKVGSGLERETYTVFHLLRDIGVRDQAVDYLEYVKPQATLDIEASPVASEVFLKPRGL